MIKKVLTVLIVSALALSAVSCGSTANVKTNAKNSGVADVLKQAESSATKNEASTESETKQASDSDVNKKGKKADIDLTELNSNMVYSEVYNVISEPEKYVGKTFRMKGTADIFTDSNTKKTYYSCIIKDAAACCANGLEFQLNDENDYPKRDEEVTVYGTFDTYKEKKLTYCVIKDAVRES